MGEVCIRVEGGGGGQPQVLPGLLYKLTGQEASKRGLPQGPVKVKALSIQRAGSVTKCTKIGLRFISFPRLEIKMLTLLYLSRSKLTLAGSKLDSVKFLLL